MPFIVSPPPPTANQSLTPYIANVQGVALVGQSSKIEIKGINFNSDSQLICNLGVVSNIQKTPESITFDILATAPGSTPIEIRNGGKSSIDWGVSTPILIARNSLNITNGWIDFRTANSNNFGTVTSHINATNLVKTFANSGYGLDPVRGLIFSNPINTANSANNFIQFDNYVFPLAATNYEIIVSVNTVGLFSRTRVGIGEIGFNNATIFTTETASGSITNYMTNSLSNTNKNSLLDALFIRVPTLFPANSELLQKIQIDFNKKTVRFYRMNNINNLDIGELQITSPLFPTEENLPINYVDLIGIPLFQFLNVDSLSSVVAMKIE